MEGDGYSNDASGRKKPRCLNATNVLINSYNVCKVIVKNRFSGTSFRYADTQLGGSLNRREKGITGYFSFIIII